LESRPVRKHEGVTSPHERLDLAPDVTSVRAARAFVTGVLSHWGLPDAIETATLLVSELATNAVRHASTRYAVVVTRTATGAHVDVLDDTEQSPQPAAVNLEADNGRGLLLVAGLATSWGPTPDAERRGFAKGVRFTLTTASVAAGASQP
jgi:anti-sigma regulatory factor (Ser/Thr protein kinase)